MKTPIHALRLVLLALLIQFSSPVFFSVITAGTPLIDQQGKATLHANHTSIVAPLLIKEKDESETDTFNFLVNLVALIDFTDHSSVLTERHAIKIKPLGFRDRFDLHPPLFTLFGVFLI